MRFPTGRHALAALAPALLAGACGDATGVERLRGTFVLVAVDGGGPPPVVLVDHTFRNGQRLVIRVLADTMRVTSDSTMRRAVRDEAIYYEADGTMRGPVPGAAAYPGRFRQRGDTIVVTWAPLGEPPRPDTLYVRGRTLLQRRLVGFVCAEGCPPPRLKEFSYTRR